jgi:hypothetical protein
LAPLFLKRQCDRTLGAGQPCECVARWGWRGRLCDADVDECAVAPGDHAAAGVQAGGEWYNASALAADLG